MRARWFLLAPLLTLTSLALASASPAQHSSEPHSPEAPWYSIQTLHLISYSSDGQQRDAREAAVRGEQLIAVFGEIFHRKEINFSPPLRVLAGHAAVSGADSGSGTASPRASSVCASLAGTAKTGTAETPTALIRTPEADFVTVDFSQPDSWTQAAKLIASLTLEDNYPRAQPWFDCGIASYLAGVQFNGGGQMQLGGPPLGMALLGSGEWIPMTKLLAVSGLAQLPAAQRASFEAESWALVRWLIDNRLLAQAGAYLNAVRARGIAPEQAVADAFAMTLADLDRRVRESLEKPCVKSMPAPGIESSLLKPQKLSAADAHVIEADLALAGSEPERALNKLVALMRVNQENAAAHRSLAWAFLMRRDFDNAVEHIRRALALDDSDPAMHYLYARWVNHGDEDSIGIESAGTRMGTELKAALKRDPNYADALELLGLVELSDGETKAALADLGRASALSPRRDRYYLNLGRAYEAAGNLDAARSLMLYASGGGDAALSRQAEESLAQLGKEHKRRPQWSAGLLPDPNAKHSKYENLEDAIAEDKEAEAKGRSMAEQPDMRTIENLQGRIVSVECGSPGAILKVTSAGRIWQMHVADRNAIVLIGMEQFDCGWHDAAVSINYKRSGDLQGDLISLEAN